MSKTKSNFGIALYYPYINVRNINWLKCALLYWDSVRRIVPHFIFESKRDDQYAEFARSGLLIDTPPDDYRNEAGDLFEQNILPIVEERKTYKSQLRDAEILFGEEPVTIYPTKVSGSLQETLRNLDLSRNVEGWLEMDAAVAGFYMICLASTMSKRIHAPMVTDTSQFETAGQYLSFGEPSSRNLVNQNNNFLINLGIKFPKPQDLEDVSFDNLIKFRENRCDERRRFRKAVEDIQCKASELTDPNALADFLNDQRQEIAQAISNYKQTLADLRITSLASSLNVTCPAVIVAAMSMPDLDSISRVLLGIGGITIGAVGWWADVRRERRNTIRSSPWHYLLPLNEAFP